ncbi:MAG: RHS repeat-associated core domain-containing protein [Porticoccaceae bacterium]|nr:RHS repeat-associated core domain-containing protein [Porticoccaceae bacterium]
MGGRVYDAEIGRFLSADPFVDDATNLQSLNRYTYVNNNPLSYTDPSGYFKNPLKKIGKAIGKAFKAIGDGIKTGLQKIGRLFADVPGLSAFAAALACTAGPWTCATVGKFMLGLNAAITAANGGTLGQIMTDLAIGGVAFGIPGMGDGLAGQLNGVIKNELGSVMLMGGIISKAQGGKFIDGVKGAAIGAAAGAIGRGIGSAKQAGVSVLGEITHELRVLAGVRPPASAQLSTAVHELGIAPGFVPYNGPVHTNTFVPTYASAAARNTATGFSSRGNGSGWSASQIDVDMALGLRSARNFQNASVCAALCTIPIALAPGAAAVGASVGALVDYSGGSSITIGSVVSDATISAIVSPIGYARYAGGHPVAHGLDFIRTYSAGTGVEAIISN